MLPVIYSDDFLLHKTGMLHPERPERLTAIVNALKAAPWAAQIEWQLPTPVAQREQALFSALKKVHAQRYIKEVEHLAHRGGGYLDGDTPISAESYDVALLAASAWLDGVDRVLAAGEPAFVLARPPGHHAEKARAMGFCLFSNAAIAATTPWNSRELTASPSSTGTCTTATALNLWWKTAGKLPTVPCTNLRAIREREMPTSTGPTATC